jgi:ABC-type thiamin/hydroxymethylpyrimidine transport system permease subunit
LVQAEIRFEKNPDYVFRKIVDELVLVPICQDVADMDCIYTMNPVGALIWEKVDGQATLAEIQAAVADQYDADPQAVAADVAGFLQELEAAGAVRRV